MKMKRTKRCATHLALGLLAAALFGCSEDAGRPGTQDSSQGKDAPIGGDVSVTKPDSTVAGDSTAPPQDLGPLVGEGYAVGQIALDWTLKDHAGNTVNLYDYRGKVIYFESGSEW